MSKASEILSMVEDDNVPNPNAPGGNPAPASAPAATGPKAEDPSAEPEAEANSMLDFKNYKPNYQEGKKFAKDLMDCIDNNHFAGEFVDGMMEEIAALLKT